MTKTTRSYLAPAVLLAPALLLTSCGPRVSKGDVYQAVSRNIKVGASKPEVEKYLRSLEVNGVRATVGDYVPNTSRLDVVGADGRGVIFDGSLDATFHNGVVGSLSGCGGVWATFLFDEDGKLITYQIVCAG